MDTRVSPVTRTSPSEEGAVAQFFHKIPLKNDGARAFVGALLVIGVACLPKVVGGKTKPGHGLLDSEMPEEVRMQMEGKQGNRS